MNTKISDAVMVYFKRKGSASEDRIPAISVESCCVDPELITRVHPLHLAADAAPVGYRWRHSAGEKWQYSDVPCGWEHEPLFAHSQPAALNEVGGDSGEVAFAREAVSYSHNFATAKPDIRETERQHILGLCRVVERLTAALAATGKPQESK